MEIDLFGIAILLGALLMLLETCYLTCFVARESLYA